MLVIVVVVVAPSVGGAGGAGGEGCAFCMLQLGEDREAKGNLVRCERNEINSVKSLL